MHPAEVSPPPGRAPAEHIRRVGDELHAATIARPQDPSRLAAALEAAIGAARRWPQAADVVAPGELLGELSETYERLDRPADALSVMREAIDAGYAGRPDPRCRLAEIHLRAGNPEPAHEIFAEVLAESPQDVWLYNNAGLEYGHAGDPQRALDWLTPGLELALATGDPEQLVAQLSDPRREQLAALGLEHDELEHRADAFLDDPPPRPSRFRPGDLAPALEPFPTSLESLPPALDCLDRAGAGSLTPAAAVPTQGAEVAMAFSWFPPGDFTAALAAWPQLAQDWGTTDHTAYSRELQRHLAQYVDTAAGPRRASALWIVPIQVEAFRAWCARSGHDPATGDARAGYAAEQARTRTEVIVWPPARNQRCWCGSPRKYKQCCGHPTVTAR